MQRSDFDLRGAPKNRLRNITNSAGIQLAVKNSAAARRRLTKFGVPALSVGAGV